MYSSRSFTDPPTPLGVCGGCPRPSDNVSHASDSARVPRSVGGCNIARMRAVDPVELGCAGGTVPRDPPDPGVPACMYIFLPAPAGTPAHPPTASATSICAVSDLLDLLRAMLCGLSGYSPLDDAAAPLPLAPCGAGGTERVLARPTLPEGSGVLSAASTALLGKGAGAERGAGCADIAEEAGERPCCRRVDIVVSSPDVSCTHMNTAAPAGTHRDRCALQQAGPAHGKRPVVNGLRNC